MIVILIMIKKCFNCGILLSSNYKYHTCVKCIKDKEQNTTYELKILEDYDSI